MPYYIYKRSDNGQRVQLFMSIAELTERQNDRCEIVLDDGVVATRDWRGEKSDFQNVGGATWPMCSDALGVAPSQIEEATKEARALGVPTEFMADGRAVLTGPQHRKALAEATGHYDLNGGYSDPQRRNRNAEERDHERRERLSREFDHI